MPKLKFSVEGTQALFVVQERVNRGLKAGSEETEKFTRSQAELGRITKKVMKDNEDAQQRLARLTKEVAEAHNFGKLSAEQRDAAQSRLNKQFKDGTGEFAKFHETQKMAFGPSGLANITSWALQFVSAAAAARLVTEELQTQQRLATQTSAAALTISQAENEVARNLPGVSQQRLEEVLGRGQALAQKLRIEPQYVQQALAKALGPSGGDVDLALQTIEPSLRFLRDQPAAAPELSQTTGAVRGITGTSDAYTNFGYVLNTGARSSITEPGLLARNVGPALTAIAGEGATATEASNIFVAISNALDERRGDLTGATGQALVRKVLGFDFGLSQAQTQLDQARNVTISGGAFGQSQVDTITAAEQELSRRQSLVNRAQSFTGDDRVDQTIELIRRSGLIEQFNPSENIPQKAQGAVAALLGPGPSRLREELDIARGTFVPQGKLAEFAERTIANVGSTTLGQRATGEQRLEAFAQQQSIRPGRLGTLSERTRDIINDELRRSGFSAIETFAVNRAIDVGGNTPEAAISTLQGLKSLTTNQLLTPLGGRQQAVGQGRDIQDMINILQAILEEQRETKDVLKSSEGLLAEPK